MKWKVICGVLLIAAIGLALALNSRHQKARQDAAAFEARLLTLSNDLRQTHEKWVEQTKVNTVLDSDLTSRSLELTNTASRVNELSNLLVKTEAEVRAATGAAEAARQEVARRDGRINELEGEKDEMSKRLGELNSEIGHLETRIAETQRKLAASEGDREFLVQELKRLQAEKAELERRFNDLAILRDQVRKLREELSMARRIEWIRRGLYGSDMKGAERLVKGAAFTQPRTNYDLNVEIHQDGNARILPPTPDAPPATPTPPAPNPTPQSPTP